MSLHDFCSNKQGMTFVGQKHVLKSALAGLSFMHSHGLLHGDVHPGHILLRGRGPFRSLFIKEARKRLFGTGTVRSTETVARDPNWNAEELYVLNLLPEAFEVDAIIKLILNRALWILFFLVSEVSFHMLDVWVFNATREQENKFSDKENVHCEIFYIKKRFFQKIGLLDMFEFSFRKTDDFLN